MKNFIEKHYPSSGKNCYTLNETQNENLPVPANFFWPILLFGLFRKRRKTELGMCFAVAGLVVLSSCAGGGEGGSDIPVAIDTCRLDSGTIAEGPSCCTNGIAKTVG